MPAPPTIASRALRKLIDGLPRLELAADRICAAAGVAPGVADDPDARVPLADLHALWEAILAERPRPDLALVAPAPYAPSDYGLLGFVCATAATLAEAMRHVVRHSRLWTDAPRMTLDDRGVLVLDYAPPLPDRPGLRLATEAAVIELVHGARAISGRADLVPRAVEIAHPAPSDVTAHARLLGVPPRFGAGRTALVLDPALLAAPLPRADAPLGAFLDGLARAAMVRRGEPSELLASVRAAIGDALPRGVPGIAAIARQMATSERTLRRRLERERASFRALIDATRAELAKAYLADRRLPLCEVAFLLGYAEQSAFHRAFKRWTGQTPAAWRARAA
jgi:AraC-like DNA-binding protein